MRWEELESRMQALAQELNGEVNIERASVGVTLQAERVRDFLNELLPPENAPADKAGAQA